MRQSRSIAAGLPGLWLLALANLSPAILAQENDMVTVFVSNTRFDNLRTCAQRCFTLSYDDYARDLLGRKLGCPLSTYGSTESLTSVTMAENQCYCRQDLQDNAQSHLSECVSEKCQRDTNEIASATDVYAEYCERNGYTAGTAKTSGGSGRSGGGDDDTSGPSPVATRTNGEGSPTDGPTSSAISWRGWSDTFVVLLVVAVSLSGS